MAKEVHEGEAQLREAVELYRRATELRYQGEPHEARAYIVLAIRAGNMALDRARNRLLCRDVVSFLSAAVAFQDGLASSRR